MKPRHATQCKAFDAFLDEKYGGDLTNVTIEEALAQFQARQLGVKTPEESPARNDADCDDPAVV